MISSRTLVRMIFLMSPMFFSFKCGKETHLEITGEWYIKNSTDQILTVYFPPFSYWKKMEIGDSLSLFDSYNDPPNFEDWPKFVARWYPKYEDMLLKISSENGTLLKAWCYSEKELPGKQLFKESSWRCYQLLCNNTYFSNSTYLRTIWVFDIFPEDLTGEGDGGNSGSQF